MALTWGEAADRVRVRLGAVEAQSQDDFEAAIARAVELTAIDGASAAAVLGTTSTELLRVLGLPPSEVNVGLAMSVGLTLLLAGYEMGCEAGD